MTKNVYTHNQSNLHAAVMVSGVSASTKVTDVFELTHSYAGVMNKHLETKISRRQADNVAKEICAAFGI